MPHHILVVDDEPDMQHIIELAFKRQIKAGLYEFYFALNGVDALDLLKSHSQIRLILTDLNMPKMNGLTLLSKIREVNELARSVVISAWGDMGNIREAMNLGAFDFLTKPIDLKDLKITIEKTLNQVDLITQAIESRDNYIALKKELDIARTLQRSMMPNLPLEFDNIRIEGQMKSSSDVGGDFWDFIKLNDQQCLFVLGDCSGHGLSSALIMSAIRHSLRTLVTQVEKYQDILPALNHIVYTEFKAKRRYATMIFILFEKDQQNIRFFRAGHELPVFFKSSELQEFDDRGGLPIGIFPSRHNDEWLEFELGCDDELYLYTDGITEGSPSKDIDILKVISNCKDQLISHGKGVFTYLREHQNWESNDDATLLRVTRT